MTSLPGPSTAFQVVRPNRNRDKSAAFVVGEGVTFALPAGEVRATVLGVDRKARADLPLGLPYRLVIRQSPAHSGYGVGAECTIRAGCLDRDATAPPPPPALTPMATLAPARPAAPVTPLFLVAYLREGGNVPVQGTVLVEGETLQAASAAAMAMLTAELEADVTERGELPAAMVMLLNAAEVPPPAPPTPGAAERVLASVSW